MWRVLGLYLLLWFVLGLVLVLVSVLVSIVRKQPSIFRFSVDLFKSLWWIQGNMHLRRCLILFLLRLFWEAPQSFAGYLWLNFRNWGGKIKRMEFEDGVMIVLSEGNYRGVSFGEFVEVQLPRDKIRQMSRSDMKCYLIWHEFGHSLDSRRLGPFYLPVVGIPSVLSAVRGGRVEKDGKIYQRHSLRTYEMRANRLAARYMQKHYGKAWQPSGNDYPLS